MKKKLIRITTVPISLDKLIEGQLAFMNTTYEVIGVSSQGKILEAVALKEEVRCIPVEMTRTISPFKDLKSVLEMYRLFKKEKPFIVHTHTPKAGVVGMLAAKLANVPNRMHTVAGMPLLEAIGFKRKVLNFVEWLTYACATKVYPNSYGLKDIILNNKLANETKLKVLSNGSSNGINTSYFDSAKFLDSEKANLKKELEIQETDFVFIFVGRLVGDKGINELINAFERLQHSKLKTQNSKLLLVGSLESELDPLQSKTLEVIKTDPNIISVGYQQDVRPYLAIATTLVFPSYREGFPNVVMQAGAMGLPSIVSNINGCNEIIREGENGWIIPVKDTAAILNAMTNCLTNSEQFFKAKTNARQLIVDRYEQQVVWEAILEEYKSLEKGVN